MNLPNKITLSRIFIVPVFLLFVIPLPEWILESSFLGFIQPQLVSINNFIMNYGNYIAAGIFILAGITDRVDGYIARKHKLITTFGKFLDPIADKLLIAAALIALVQRNDITSWTAILIISREFIVTGLRLVAVGEGIIISASKIGKLKTVTQIVAIAAILLKDFPLSLISTFPFGKYAMLIAVIITLYSLFDYLAKNIRHLNIHS
ncbi:MAG: CDP-diacylglycerol--glycerol-3-phosphate 3-phosphatidyltransferase [Ruminiclostridium sp.]|nr:CDP-diacylglycerol--glycerol-3-phosphate 3-phosphatidyltransferase [Ruminiclostridium sp.]